MMDRERGGMEWLRGCTWRPAGWYVRLIVRRRVGASTLKASANTNPGRGVLQTFRILFLNIKMKKLLVIAGLIWSTASIGQEHRLERICGIKKTVVNFKLFNLRQIRVFNDYCLLSSYKEDGDWVEYSYKSNSRYDSVVCRIKKRKKSVTAAEGWNSVYAFDSLGRLSQEIFDRRHSGVTIKTNYYQDTTKRLLLTRIVSKYTLREYRFYYDTDQSKKCNKQEEYVDGKLSGMMVFAYDGKGNIILEDSYYREDDEWVLNSGYVGGFPCSPCQLEYDSRGNWIRKYIVGSHKKTLYATRRIRYGK